MSLRGWLSRSLTLRTVPRLLRAAALVVTVCFADCVKLTIQYVIGARGDSVPDAITDIADIIEKTACSRMRVQGSNVGGTAGGAVDGHTDGSVPAMW